VAGEQKDCRRRPFLYETYHGLKVLRVFNLDIPWNIPILRGVDQFVSAFFAGVAGAWLPDFDAALVYSPPLPLALAALALCRARRRPLMVNIQDLFPQSAIDLGVLTNPHLIRVFRGLESFLFRQADLIAVHSGGNRDYVLNAGGKPGKVKVIQNWVDTEAIQPGPRSNGLRASLGLDHYFLVYFAGIMGYSQDLETVVHSAGILKDHREIAFLLVGDGVEKPKLEKLVQENRLNNVSFLPMQPKEKYLEVLSASDLCLVTLRPEVQTPVVPSKILSIMAAGRPVLAGLPLGGDAPRLIADAQCGLSVPPGNPEAMAQAVLQLYQDHKLRKQMGICGRKYAVEHLSLKRAAEIVENHIHRIHSPSINP
jgi:glycosyltransferase involved in cell wall biosynthesis